MEQQSIAIAKKVEIARAELEKVHQQMAKNGTGLQEARANHTAEISRHLAAFPKGCPVDAPRLQAAEPATGGFEPSGSRGPDGAVDVDTIKAKAQSLKEALAEEDRRQRSQGPSRRRARSRRGRPTTRTRRTTSRLQGPMQPWVRLSSWGEAGTDKDKALRMFFANIATWGKTAERFLDEHRMSDFHSIAVVETHLAAPDLRKMVPRLQAWGRRGFGSTALATGRSEASTSGGGLVGPCFQAPAGLLVGSRRVSASLEDQGP